MRYETFIEEICCILQSTDCIYVINLYISWLKKYLNKLLISCYVSSDSDMNDMNHSHVLYSALCY